MIISAETVELVTSNEVYLMENLVFLIRVF